MLKKEEIPTILKLAHLHRSRAETHEEHAVFLVLSVELSHNNVQGRFGRRVQSTGFNLGIYDKVEIAMTARNRNNLLHPAFHDKREEEIKEVDIADNIGLEKL